MTLLYVGIDVGSTTVKAVVVDPESKEILWSDYLRHNTKQPEMTLSFLERIEAAFPDHSLDQFRMFMTGSGASPLIKHLGAKFVQEVNAVTMAVEQTAQRVAEGLEKKFEVRSSHMEKIFEERSSQFISRIK